MNRQAGIDVDVVDRVVVVDELILNPYRDFDTLVAKLTTLKTYLISVASQNDTVHYEQVTATCDIFPTRHGRLLGILGIHEAALEDPLLPAVVVQKNNPGPGDGYFAMVRKAPGRTTRIPDDRSARLNLWQRHLSEVHTHW